MAEIVIGVDGGTTAVKAVAFDLDGKIKALHHESVPVQYGQNGEAEQNMDMIWEAVANCLHEVAAATRGDKIVGIGLTGQGDGAWLIDEEGEPVRPAANWLDGRAAKRVQEWNSDGRAKKVLDVTGTTIFGGLFPVLYEELRESEPETISRSATHLNCKDWIRFKLTGERLTDYTEASRSFFNIFTGEGFDEQLAKDLSMEEALELLPEVRHPAGPAVGLSEQAAKKTGIPAGTPVGVGMIDVAVTAMGLGAIEDGASYLILGTTGFVGTLLPDAKQRRSDLSMVLATGNGKQVLEFMAPMTGTPNLDWIRMVLRLDDADWGEIESRARRAPAGSHGVVYLPYASPGGERAPFSDVNASASWQGLSLTTKKRDILRSVYEGVSFTLAECVDVLKIEGDLIVSGGGFRSDLVCEILADTTGKRVLRQDTPEAGARGAAVLALVSAGRYETIEEASGALGTEMEIFDPNPELRDRYQHIYEVFKKTRDAARTVWPELRELRTVDAE
ncbi:FGGY-family carbohydrate kinase [Propionimicrobium lymphophilum]|uniref:FGGY-family carbohydrate kinase n=1 Tax=Propionimicrobium TaxID=203133 RepID=UPI0003D79BA5|nr:MULTISPECIES: FGGY-family carbohydrate kinase [Propionimicrobium]ETJ96941.1 carbohydrate kinase, FGGY family protein [Propionimicrobium sp. BV2F7]MDK7710690.1 FGGY-family carbohydrate kinase [Propionimicrobium lymphophilum]MDK7734357.1 FGGY-family carbohydrate kinase [Propionimicrobium lymphophilum]